MSFANAIGHFCITIDSRPCVSSLEEDPKACHKPATRPRYGAGHLSGEVTDQKILRYLVEVLYAIEGPARRLLVDALGAKSLSILSKLTFAGDSWISGIETHAHINCWGQSLLSEKTECKEKQSAGSCSIPSANLNLACLHIRRSSPSPLSTFISIAFGRPVMVS